MPITVTCPNCREELEIPNELLGGDVRCGSCLEVFKATAPPGSEVPPPLPDDDDRPRRPRRKSVEPTRNKPVPVSRRDDGYGPIEFDPDRRQKKGVGATIWIVLGVFGLLGCGCCGIIGYLGIRTAMPDYKPFRDPDGRFVAEFPADVHEKTRATGVPRFGSVKSFEADRPLIQEKFFVYTVPLNDAEKKNPAQAIKALADGLRVANSATEVSREDTTHQGHEAVDLVVRVRRDQHVRARIIVADDRAYVIGVSAHDDPNEHAWLDHFFESFEVVPPDAKKDDKKPAKK